MERFERREHGVDVVVTVEEARRLLEALVPELVPQDGDPDELLRDEDGLLDERRAVVAHLVHDREGGATTSLARVLGRDRERVDERLRVRPPDVGEDVLDELAHGRVGRVDAGDELYDNERVRERAVREEGEPQGERGGGRRTCGTTSSQVSIETLRKPSMMAVDTSLT